MTLEELNKKYVYKYDFRWYDTWTGLNGNFEGDCEDYCITLKKEVKEFKDWNYYYCKLNGVGHCILSDGIDMIDCNCKRVMSLGSYQRNYNVTNLKKYNWFVVFSKLLVGKINLLFK